MARPKSVKIQLSPKQKAELKRLTGEDHSEVMFESVKTYRTGEIASKATLASKTAPRRLKKEVLQAKSAPKRMKPSDVTKASPLSKSAPKKVHTSAMKAKAAPKKVHTSALKAKAAPRPSSVRFNR